MSRMQGYGVGNERTEALFPKPNKLRGQHLKSKKSLPRWFLAAVNSILTTATAYMFTLSPRVYDVIFIKLCYNIFVSPSNEGVNSFLGLCNDIFFVGVWSNIFIVFAAFLTYRRHVGQANDQRNEMIYSWWPAAFRAILMSLNLIAATSALIAYAVGKNPTGQLSGSISLSCSTLIWLLAATHILNRLGRT